MQVMAFAIIQTVEPMGMSVVSQQNLSAQIAMRFGLDSARIVQNMVMNLMHINCSGLNHENMMIGLPILFATNAKT